jgi:hypothetical protein
VKREEAAGKGGDGRATGEGPTSDECGEGPMDRFGPLAEDRAEGRY